MAETNPTGDSGSVGLSATVTPEVKKAADDLTIVSALKSYKFEADNARKAGLNPRDQKWEDNLNLYWNRKDFTKKADWQAREVMPEVPSYVDRFAAAMKEALVAMPEGFYTVFDPADQESDLTQAVKNMTDVWLSRAGRNQMGMLLPFSSVFEEQMKMGAIMACASVVTWKGDVPNGRVAVETVDPRFVWLDPTYRNLYRVRRIELDRHDLYGMAKAKDGKGKPIWNLPEIERLVAGINVLDQQINEQRTGHGVQQSSGRQPIVLDEYIATVLDNQGNVIADRALIVVANEQYLVRGPEKNPFWHGQDWMVYAPLVTAPLSVYGRSYMEDFASVANTFNELTNMILDAVHTSSLKAFAVIPSMLLNPDQLLTGITPNKMFLLEDGATAKDFATALDLGTLPPDAVRVWETMKKELSEAAGINEIGMGQFAPKGRTSATEVTMTQQSSSALVRSVAQTVETRYLDPTLDLIWKTGLQHARQGDKALIRAAGETMYPALLGMRREFISQPFTFQARGISQMIRKSNTLKTLMSLMQVVASNDMLMAQFLKTVSPEKLVKKLFELGDVDLSKLSLSDRERAVQAAIAPIQQAQQNVAGAPAPQGQAPPEMQDVAATMGIAA